MKTHELVFSEIKKLLHNCFPNNIEEHENGMYLSIADSGIWISADDRELTVGNGLVHQHYDPDYDDLAKAVELFFNLLTCRKKRTDYFKGEFAYKHKVELELPDGTYENLGTAMTWLFPFWKRTDKKVTYEDGLINTDNIKPDLLNIKKLCTTNAKPNRLT